MTTTTRKFNVGDPVLVDMPSYCPECGREDIGAYGTVVEHGIYGQYVVTLDSARDATGYDPDGNPVHVCGLRMICNDAELKLVDWRRSGHESPAFRRGEEVNHRERRHQ